MYLCRAKLKVCSRKGTQMEKQLTIAQIKAKRADEIACRISFAFAGIVFIAIAVSKVFA